MFFPNCTRTYLNILITSDGNPPDEPVVDRNTFSNMNSIAYFSLKKTIIVAKLIHSAAACFTNPLQNFYKPFVATFFDEMQDLLARLAVGRRFEMRTD